MTDKPLQKKRQHVRKIFKLGNNGKTFSHVITIPKNFLKVLEIKDDDKVIISMENKNDYSFVKILKLDATILADNILQNKTEKRKTSSDSQEFENWD